MKQLKHEFECGCVVTLAVGGELEPSVIASKANQISYCEKHGQPAESEPFTIDVNHEFHCGCEVDLTVTIKPAGDDSEVTKTAGDIDYCDKHDERGDADILVSLTLLAEGKHHISCPQDQWCDCRTRLATDAIAELEAA